MGDSYIHLDVYVARAFDVEDLFDVTQVWKGCWFHPSESKEGDRYCPKCGKETEGWKDHYEPKVKFGNWNNFKDYSSLYSLNDMEPLLIGFLHVRCGCFHQLDENFKLWVGLPILSKFMADRAWSADFEKFDRLRNGFSVEEILTMKEEIAKELKRINLPSDNISVHIQAR